MECAVSGRADKWPLSWNSLHRAIAILNKNPHLKHEDVSKCHFRTQLPFYSLIFSQLGNRDSLEFTVCGVWGGFSGVEHLLKHVQDGPTRIHQVEIS